MKDRILITGGAGFIGSNIAAALLQRPNTDVVIADDFSSGNWRNLINVDAEVRAVFCDDVQLLQDIASGHFSAVYHEAAITDTTVMNQKLMMNVNTDAFAAILEAANKSATRVIYASSAGTYGNTPAPNCIGSGEQPENIYGFSKLAMDRIAYRWHDRHSAPIIGLRYFNVYGSGEHHKNEHEGTKTASMILQWYQAIQAGNPIRMFEFGDQRRDFVYIGDVIGANLAALEAPRSGVCNVGSGKARSYNDIVSNLNRILNIDHPTEYIHNPYPFFQDHTEADLSESKAILSWKPQFSLEQGMDEYIALLEKNHRGPVATA
ncbi:MAG: ADP-glyceromanno-heptose 6-epimerase [Ghiorsea sp.]|nr:ADP-glyceromanno-heptose 6-epimerase [Ghiorsea sp.]